MIGFASILTWVNLIPRVLAQEPIRYMPFGDSITDYGCWRPWVGQKLEANGFDVDFVGSREAQATCGSLDYDRNHEGHPGNPAVDIARDNLLVDWLEANPADIITMHLGTVDIVRSSRAPGEILDAYTKLVGQMRDSNPAMKIIVAQIIPFPANDGLVQSLNRAIPTWAEAINSTISPIWVVDQWTGFDGGVDLYDGLHPSESGDLKISEKFYPAIAHAVGCVLRDRLHHDSPTF